MPETEKTKAKSPKSPKAKGPTDPESPRSLSMRADRSLKDVDRLLEKNPETPPQQRAILQLEQAKVSALLELAEAIRANNKG